LTRKRVGIPNNNARVKFWLKIKRMIV
jgi:hypothetical protein